MNVVGGRGPQRGACFNDTGVTATFSDDPELEGMVDSKLMVPEPDTPSGTGTTLHSSEKTWAAIVTSVALTGVIVAMGY